MGRVRELGEQLQNTVDKYRADLAAVERDPRLAELRDDVRRVRTERERQALRQNLGARVSSAIRELIGTDDDPDSGRLWQEERSVKEALRAAKTSASVGLDWHRVGVEAQRLPSVLTTTRTVGELHDWYSGQGGHERMAMQTAGSELLRHTPHLQGDPEMGAFLSELEADRQETMTTDAVEAAAAKAERAIGEGVDAVRAAQRAVDALNLGPFTPEAGLLRRVRIHTKVDSAQGGTVREWFTRVPTSSGVVWPAEAASTTSE